MDEPDFATAMTANFSEHGFVASFPVCNPRGKPFLAVCKREQGAPGDVSEGNPPCALALNLTVTDCLSGIFRRRFGFDGLSEMRREVGMAEFAWGGFLKLLSSAFRNQGGCSATISLTSAESAPAATESRMQLTLRFQLQAAALVTKVDLGACAVGPVAALGLDKYLGELHGFVVSAVEAASGSGTGNVPLSGQATCFGDETLQMSTLSFGVPSTLPCLNGFTAPASSDKRLETLPGSMSVAARSAKPAAKKRVGSLVEPNVRKVRGVGTNPFQLAR
jgi:hypothetical protein